MTLSFTAAFVAGLFSFLSPCVLPLVPTYLLYLGGEQGKPLRNALFFVLGFGLVFFILIGLPATLLGSLLQQNQSLLGKIGGVLLVLFGLYMLGLKPAFLRQGVNLRYEGDTSRPWGAFMLGAVLGLGWTPCIGPVLGGIMGLAANGGGLGLALAYILGLAVPFFLVAAFADRVRPVLRRASRFSHWAELTSGAALVVTGLLLLTGTWTRLNAFFNSIVPGWLSERL
jgi:cytochrome c-type biogenesis protein